MLDEKIAETGLEKYKLEQELQQLVNEYNTLSRLIQEKDKLFHTLTVRLNTLQEVSQLLKQDTHDEEYIPAITRENKARE